MPLKNLSQGKNIFFDMSFIPNFGRSLQFSVVHSEFQSFIPEGIDKHFYKG